MNNKIKLIIIEGNIGAGKTTLINKLAECLKAKIFVEPIEEWNKLNTGYSNVLEALSKNPNMFAGQIQMYIVLVYMNYLVTELKNTKTEYLIIERSIWAFKNVFTKLNVDKNFINDREQTILTSLFNFCESILEPFQQFIIFIDTPPNVCIDRIKYRNRKGEEGVTLGYINLISKYYNELYKLKSVYIYKSDEDTKMFIKKLNKKSGISKLFK